MIRYILTKNDSNEPLVYEVENTIKTLQANKIHLNENSENIICFKKIDSHLK